MRHYVFIAAAGDYEVRVTAEGVAAFYYAPDDRQVPSADPAIPHEALWTQAGQEILRLRNDDDNLAYK